MNRPEVPPGSVIAALRTYPLVRAVRGEQLGAATEYLATDAGLADSLFRRRQFHPLLAIVAIATA